MIELPSWGRQLLSFFSKSSFEQWAGMSLQTALQIKQIQHSLRESWVLGQERHYGSTRNNFNRKLSEAAQSTPPVLEANIRQAQSERKTQTPFQANRDAKGTQPFYNAPTPYPLGYSQSARFSKSPPGQESQDFSSSTVMDDLLQLHSERNAFAEKNLISNYSFPTLYPPKGRGQQVYQKANFWSEPGLEAAVGSEVQPKDKSFSSKPHLSHELSSQYYTGNAAADLAESETLKMAIEKALSQALAASQSRKSKKKYLYLAPWPKQRA